MNIDAYCEDYKPDGKVMNVRASSAKQNAERDLTGSWGNFNCKSTFREITEVK